jgi:hypothetical protein
MLPGSREELMTNTRLHVQPTATPAKCSMPVRGGVLQRKCDCGGSPGVEGECEGCSKQGLSMQRSTQNSEVGTRNPAGVPPIVHDVLSLSGQPLDAATRAFMEPRFSHDFSDVRVHADTRAAQSAEAVNALAYTVGKNVVFAAGQYQPGSAQGRHLLAHELAHTIQQADHGAMSPQRLSVGRTDDALERQADALADYVVSPSSAGAPPAMQRGQNPAPILRRQPCRKADDTIVTGPLAERLPDIPCEPTGETLATVRAAAATQADILGITQTSRSGPDITYNELRASKCQATVNSNYTMSFSQFMFTKEGTYDDGTETRPRGACCAGQLVTRRLRITAAMAQKLKAGEIEHCQDHKLAFAMSEGKFNQAIKDLQGEYCPDTTPPAAPKCKEEFAQRFKDRTGFDFPQAAGNFSDCLHHKTKLRDDAPNRWHSISSDDWFCAPDCSAVTYIPNPASMNNIGNHASSTIVKDCP